MTKQKNLFKTKVVPGKPGSGKLFDEEIVSNNEPVSCLGLEFENDDARRAHFTEELRKKLQDPEFRKIEGFPIGEDEDILKLSDPPYYTACPNPWIADFIKEWEKEKNRLIRQTDADKKTQKHNLRESAKSVDTYHREPFAADVSEGKNDPIYNAHSYHTKVPHKAIMRYILHYTEPGDIVFDGFCGTGMTGVAAQMCGDRATVESLGYKVDKDGIVYEKQEVNPQIAQMSADENTLKSNQRESAESADKKARQEANPQIAQISADENTLKSNQRKSAESADKKARQEANPQIAQMSADENTEKNNQRESAESADKKAWVPISKLGARKAVLNDLSPAATFIAYNYNTPVDVAEFEREAKRILAEVEEECGWMYETLHTDGKTKVKINYTVWSDILICSHCGEEVNYWEAAINKEKAEVKDIFDCKNCSSRIEKKKAEKAYQSYFDETILDIVRIVKQRPVLINYSVKKKRYEKKPDDFDIDIIEQINKNKIKYDFPTSLIEDGVKTREPLAFGATYTHLMYTKRNLSILAAALNRIDNIKNKRIRNYLKVWYTSSQTRLHRMNRYAAKHKRHVGPLANTLYISSTPTEISPFYFLKLKIKENTLELGRRPSSLTQTGGASMVPLQDNVLDYIFLDPPFGHNIMYSDLNIIWESWLRIKTNSLPEAIENKYQGKGIDEYRLLMVSAFLQAFKALKPGRWLTVEFSNTKASVWNSIQSALTEAGFVVANVAALDKGRGGLHAIIGPTAVKQDLVISAYKPNGGFEERFALKAQTEDGVWDFVRTHLKYLPVTKTQGLDLVMIPERDPRILYDQLIAYYVRKGYNLPIDSQAFQLGLSQHFSERDGMYFLPEQVAEYDRKKMLAGGKQIQQEIWIKDESSAIEWLRSLLRDKPQSFQDMNPQFMQEISGWSKNEVGLELSTLLEQNFLAYDGKGAVPEQIHSYLSSNWKDMRNLSKEAPALVAKAKDRWYVPDPNKAGDLEKLREKALLKEFEAYRERKKKFTSRERFRLEAVRAGFKKAWQERDYKVIITVAEKIPNKVLEEDPKLLMWYDQAVTRLGGD